MSPKDTQPREVQSMLGRRHSLALLTVIALTLGACTATGAPGSVEPDTQAPTPVATPEASPTASAEDTEEPTASDDAGTGDYPLTAAEGDVGPYLTGEGGLTLYYFTNDTQNAGNSVCNDNCATAWPPYVLEGADEVTPGDGVDGEITMITRDDGTTQVAYKGWPLYYYAKDSAPGDTTGHEVGGVWFVIAP
jgi:predicted lipoprotein with Yx(FWY)xxD motif